MKISEKVISELLEQINIVELISEYVDLKKSGKNYKGLCPFHSEKTPSFFVSEEKQVFHCFGCNASGNAIGFVIKYFNFEFPDAVQFLAEKYGIEISYEKDAPYSKDLYTLHNEIMIIGKRNLLLKKGSPLLKEFLAKRKLTLELIDEFDIGFIDNHDTINHIVKKYPEEVLKESGLFYRKNNRYTFKLQNRILFPIHNLLNKTVAFSGRVLDNSLPKYINSPETPIFSKRKILYNLNRAKNISTDKENIYVVEGYMDVIRMWEFGIKRTVSPMGTSFTENQANILKRYAKEIILLFDGDSAGKKAAIRALDIFLKQNIVPYVLFLPKDEDPDSFLSKYGVEKFLEYEKNNKQNLFELLIEHSWKKGKSDTYKKSHYISKLKQKAFLIKDDILRELYLKKISEKFQIDIETLKKEVDFSRTKRILKKDENKSSRICEKDFIKAVIELDNDLVDNLVSDLTEEHFMDENIKKVFKKIVEFLKNGDNISSLAYDSEIGDFISKLKFNEKPMNEYYKIALTNKLQIQQNYLKREKQRKKILLKQKEISLLKYMEELKKIDEQIIKIKKELKNFDANLEDRTL